MSRYSRSSSLIVSLSFNMSMPIVNELSGVRTCGERCVIRYVR